MISGAISIARGAWSLAGRSMKAFGAWLRRPRDWWRFIAVCLGVLCLGTAFAVRDARQQVLIVTEKCNTEILTIQGEAKTATSTAQANARALQVCRGQLADEVGKQQRIEQLAREAVAAAKRDADAAAKSMSEWQAQYNKRPATCQAALENMEAACAASIPSY